MQNDNADYCAGKIAEYALYVLVASAVFAHIITPSIGIKEEFSYGYDKGNIPCKAMMLAIMVVAGAIAYRLHEREYYIYSYPLTWLIPAMFFVMNTNVYSHAHDVAAITLIILTIIMTSMFIYSSDYSHLLKFKLWAVPFMFIFGIYSFGLMEKLLVFEGCASLYFVNKKCL